MATAVLILLCFCIPGFWALALKNTTADELDAIEGFRPERNSIRLTNITGNPCAGKALAGYYADTHLECKVFHRCDGKGSRINSFQCSPEEVFNQCELDCQNSKRTKFQCRRSKDFEILGNFKLQLTPSNDRQKNDLKKLLGFEATPRSSSDSCLEACEPAVNDGTFDVETKKNIAQCGGSPIQMALLEELEPDPGPQDDNTKNQNPGNAKKGN